MLSAKWPNYGFRVVLAPQLPEFATPFKQIQRRLMDPKGRPYEGPLGVVTYDHTLTEHGLFPLTAPEAPDALDRIWVIRGIRPDTLTLGPQAGGDRFDLADLPAADALGPQAGGAVHDCWRVDLIDPALPAGQDTVVAWVSTEIPVFGLLKWKRGGETWEFMRGEMTGGAR